MEQSLAVNGRASPDSLDLKQPLINNISILGLGGLVQSTETYSRKVFVGGLPPEVDEGIIIIQGPDFYMMLPH